MLDAGDAKHLPDTRLASSLVDGRIRLDELHLVRGRRVGHVGPYRHVVNAFVDKNLVWRH